MHHMLSTKSGAFHILRATNLHKLTKEPTETTHRKEDKNCAAIAREADRNHLASSYAHEREEKGGEMEMMVVLGNDGCQKENLAPSSLWYRVEQPKMRNLEKPKAESPSLKYRERTQQCEEKHNGPEWAHKESTCNVINLKSLMKIIYLDELLIMIWQFLIIFLINSNYTIIRIVKMDHFW